MKIHEYQGKEILRQFGVPVPRGYPAFSVREATEAMAQLADEASMTLVHMAIAFVLKHPGITSAIIGPRTMEQLETQLAAAARPGKVVRLAAPARLTSLPIGLASR